MARNILIKFPTSGLNVQCRTEEASSQGDQSSDDYQQIACPACEMFHLVNSKTGKLLGQK
ncbi:hypothetical protein [Bradyrhizobium sp. CCBAU 53421]|uniref:hypothetical protein n=1 Tax=Bradyrhizobium sp. CCBAU 53421 TaxID=1325120 RepID=UPI00188AF3FD|nr:hypothetical protein [Bradyrhizobium sp. CCBAU 53421]QOZ32825.1 hypothetical protein XH92_14945 [Bradyrhizobium sp. CCBAU 53421]